MKTELRFVARAVAWVLALLAAGASAAGAQESLTHGDLVDLFADWREFEAPPSLNGAPDYTAERFAIRQPEYKELRARLDAFDIDDWPVPEQVDVAADEHLHVEGTRDHDDAEDLRCQPLGRHDHPVDAEALGEVDPAGAQALHLPALQDHAGLVFLLQVIIEPGLLVEGDGVAATGLFLAFAGHGWKRHSGLC